MLTRRALLRRGVYGMLHAMGLYGVGAACARQAVALPASNTFVLAQLKYRGGQWDPRPRATVSLMHEVRLRTSVETRDERQVVTLEDPLLFSYPFLYMTGERAFAPFTEAERVILRRYLLFGGLLLIDDARGTKGQDFDASVRRELAQLFPDRPLRILPPEHTVFRSFYLIRTIGGVRIVNPYLEGIDIEDRTPLIYCQNGLGAAWERDYLGNWVSPCYPGGEAQRLEAFKLGVNIVLYALTVNYKQDLIHLPFIRKKLG
ncbi:MAG: hypothetical protein KatS3mg131_2573 [Candidatus Tectimicrobiota bacterium]|nr:MAG: hypothetical protein KatS3mg131_2573 [Candidatus Tectomicrobia bacterium]